MAGRWRAAQRRKRWTDHAAQVPAGALQRLEERPELGALARELSVFGQQPSTYAQLAQVKQVGKNLLSILQCGEQDLRISFRVFVELLFVENSRPLHRGLLSPLSHVPQEHGLLLQEAFQQCCLDYGPEGSKHRRFSVVAVASSLASLPNPGVMKQVAQNSVPLMVKSICEDVQGVLHHALQGGRPTPSVMEESQDALSSMYYLLQQFPEKFFCSQLFSNETYGTPESHAGRISASTRCGGEELVSLGLQKENSASNEAGSLYGGVVCMLLDVLQTTVLSRDCLVAAGVGLAAAVQLHTSNEGVALVLATVAFPSPSARSKFSALSVDKGLSTAQMEKGMLEGATVVYRRSSLRAEMEKLSDFGRLCFFRGLLTAVSRTTLNVHYLSSPLNSSGELECAAALKVQSRDKGTRENGHCLQHVWTLLYDGILPALCAFCESSVDSHFKFHAVTAMQICLQQIKTSICGNLTQAAFTDFVAAASQHGIEFESYDPLPAPMIARVLQLIWNNWEDPLTQTVKQVQVVFDLLVDVQLVHKRELYNVQAGGMMDVSESPNSVFEDESRKDKFLFQIASDLLAAGRYRKGKYVPLASLVQRIGARKLLFMSPDLLLQTIHAFSDDDVCCAASTFLKSFLERLREDCWSTDGVMEGTMVARRLWIPPLLSGLLLGDPRLRNNLTTYALPVALQIDSDSIFVMLDYVLEGPSKAGITNESALVGEELGGADGLPSHLTVDQQVVLLVSILKVARSLALALVEGAIGHTLKAADPRCEGEVEDVLIASKVLKGMSHAVFIIKGQVIEVHVTLLLLALTHKEDGLRVDATELMCLNPKTASMPSSLELCLLRIALPLNMRCSSTSFRMRWTSFIKKFFLRVRTAVERQQKAENVGKIHPHIKEPELIEDLACTEEQKGISVNPSGAKILRRVSEERPSAAILAKSDIEDEEASKLAVSIPKMQEFMQWLSQMLVASLYPSAPYERKNMAMELFYALIQVWSLNQSWEKRSGGCISSPFHEKVDFSPYHESLLSAESTLVVVGAVVDSWDKLREGAYKILIQYPTPLPGLDSELKVESLLMWAKGLANSPRVRESDAGALALRLVFRKYVVELGWKVKIHPAPQVVRLVSPGPSDTNSSPAQRHGEVIVQYLESLNDWLQWGIEEGDKDLLKACEQSFVHGVLLVLRYTVDEIEWTSEGIQSCFGSFRLALERLLSLLLRVTSLALWVVSADALDLQAKLGGPLPFEGDVSGKDRLQPSRSAMDTISLDEELESDSEEGLAPAEQIVMVGCWLSVKEVSLLLGTIARAVPLPGCPAGEFKVDRKEETETLQKSCAEKPGESVMLNGKQLEAIGNHFLQVLLSMKHNGAIDKTRTGFIALCDRLLRSSDPWLNKMPEMWLLQLMKHTGAKGQVVDDLLRRSAGIPPAFLALFLAEPDGAPKKLLPMAMRWLLDTCIGFLGESNAQTLIMKQLDSKYGNEIENANSTTELMFLPGDDDSLKGLAQFDNNQTSLALKLRDEGVVPTVHAFNVMKMAFHDTNLATDTSGFCAEGLITAIQAFGSSHWEVRNSATLAFTALVHRMIGFLNVYKRESARRAITGFEFFHRYPTLHPFLLQELKSATWQLEHGALDGWDNSSGLASSLHPSLGPVLIILSRLKPSFINSNVEDWLNPSAFMPYVTQCATQRNLQVRVLASRALPPLVSSEDLMGVMLELALSLPVSASAKESQREVSKFNQSAYSTSVVNGYQRSGVKKLLSYNAIHGVLLQMYALLTSSCTSIPDKDLQRRIVADVFRVVKECLWLGSIQHCGCSIVVGAFLDMLGGLVDVAEVDPQNLANPGRISRELQQLLTNLTYECLGDFTEDRGLVDPTRAGLREKAVKHFLQTMLTKGPNLQQALGCDHSLRVKDVHVGTVSYEGKNIESGPQAVGIEASATNHKPFFSKFTNTLKQALCAGTYEIRLTTLKVLKQHCTPPLACGKRESEVSNCSNEVFPRDFTFFRPVILDRLGFETHPLCIRRILQLIYAWALMDKVDRGAVSNATHPHSEHFGETERIIGEDSVWGSRLSARELWYSLLRIYDSSKQIKTKEESVRCLGGCLQQVRRGIGLFTNPVTKARPNRELPRDDLLDDNHHNAVALYDFGSAGKNQERSSEASAGSVSTSGRPWKDRKQWEYVKEVMNTWLVIAKRHSAASEPVNFRRATAEAIVASGLLEDTKWIGRRLAGNSDVADSSHISSNHKDTEFLTGSSDGSEEYAVLEWYGKAILSIWCICIKLLEDEDLDLRQRLSLAILDVIGSMDVVTDVVPAQVEKVIQVSFDFLSAQFGNWREYYEVLSQWLIGSDAETSLANSDMELVRRLFDKEIDNHHEEELLFVQLCCLHLERFIYSHLKEDSCSQSAEAKMSALVPNSNGSAPMCPKVVSAAQYKPFLHKWRMRHLEQAKTCAQLSVQIKVSMQWVGGVTNHQDTFKSLFRSLLGLLTFSGFSRGSGSIYEIDTENGVELVTGLTELAGHLKKLPLNPLVSNVLFLVLLSYEQQLDVSLDSDTFKTQMGSAYCTNFEHLFLIR